MKKTLKAESKPTTKSRLSAGATIAAGLPLALSMIPTLISKTTQPAKTAATTVTKPTTTPREFSISINNLNDWAKAVVVSVDAVHIEGNSGVHAQDADCELHFGAHSVNFEGSPNGLVLEPMNVCVAAFPGTTEHSNADWTKFAKDLKGQMVTALGVPRIWPEHLEGGGDSNPDHAVEIHPLTGLVAGGKSFDFAANVFAGEFRGGVSENTALKIAQNTSVTVTKSGDSAEISFNAGRIGNFTVLDLIIDRTSIAGDGGGSFRMNGEVILNDENTAPVTIVTAKGSPVNEEINQVKKSKAKQVRKTWLVLFSLSPQALLDAANQSHGNPVEVQRPLQLISYGEPD